MPVMTPIHRRLLDERRSYPLCPKHEIRTVSNDVEMLNVSGEVRITLYCPNQDRPHPGGRVRDRRNVLKPQRGPYAAAVAVASVPVIRHSERYAVRIVGIAFGLRE